MGLYLQTAVIPNCSERAARAAIEKMEAIPELELTAADCRCRELQNGVNILLNDGCMGYEGLAKALSLELKQPVMLLYILDEDYWGYYFYENGKELDSFNPMPDCYEEVSDEERRRLAGNSGVIAEYFQIAPEGIERYLVQWTEAYLDDYEAKAYEDDEFGRCDCWQMADFMRKIGYPYEW